MGSDKQRTAEAFEGELSTAPRGPLATAVLAISGILLLIEIGHLVGRIALAVHRPAEVRLTNGVLEIKGRTIVLGRVLREHRTVIPRDGLVRITREVRYPSLPMYAGLFALALGSYLGVGLAVDGVRAASPSMLGTGLLIALLGLALDFVFSSLIPGARGRARVVLVPRRGSVVCIQSVDPRVADRVLTQLTNLKRPSSLPTPPGVQAEGAERRPDVAEDDSAREA
jgi:hypothetical protein